MLRREAIAGLLQVEMQDLLSDLHRSTYRAFIRVVAARVAQNPNAKASGSTGSQEASHLKVCAMEEDVQSCKASEGF